MWSGSCRGQPQGGSSTASNLALVASSLMAVVGARSTWRAQGESPRCSHQGRATAASLRTGGGPVGV